LFRVNNQEKEVIGKNQRFVFVFFCFFVCFFYGDVILFCACSKIQKREDIQKKEERPKPKKSIFWVRLHVPFFGVNGPQIYMHIRIHTPHRAVLKVFPDIDTNLGCNVTVQDIDGKDVECSIVLCVKERQGHGLLDELRLKYSKFGRETILQLADHSLNMNFVFPPERTGNLFKFSGFCVDEYFQRSLVLVFMLEERAVVISAVCSQPGDRFLKEVQISTQLSYNIFKRIADCFRADNRFIAELIVLLERMDELKLVAITGGAIIGFFFLFLYVLVCIYVYFHWFFSLVRIMCFCSGKVLNVIDSGNFKTSLLQPRSSQTIASMLLMSEMVSGERYISLRTTIDGKRYTPKKKLEDGVIQKTKGGLTSISLDAWLHMNGCAHH
jgi:hypothetical protein